MLSLDMAWAHMVPDLDEFLTEYNSQCRAISGAEKSLALPSTPCHCYKSKSSTIVTTATSLDSVHAEHNEIDSRAERPEVIAKVFDHERLLLGTILRPRLAVVLEALYIY